MKKILPIILLFAFGLGFASFTNPTDRSGKEKLVKWYTWEEAIAANEKEPKNIFVDVYTDWCGYCKLMDKNTFEDPKVAEYLNEHFYPVKLNAEQKEDIEFNGQTFKWVEGGRRGIHTLAYALLDGNLSYPTTVFLTEKLERVAISPGFKKPKPFMKELQFTAEGHYKDKSWQEFMNSSK